MTKVETENTTCIFITYYFPPIKSVGVIRNYYLAICLKTIYHTFHVLTTSNQKILPNENLNLNEFKNIHLIKTLDYRTVLQTLFKNKTNTHYPESIKKSGIIRWIIKMNESLPFNLFMGEGGLFYIIEGYLKARQIIKTSKNKIVIFTSFRPTANIILGYLLKRKYPSISWITSFQDAPYDEIRKNLILPGLQKKLWKKMLLSSNINLATSMGIKFELDKFSKNNHVFLNGVEFRNSLLDNVKYFTICYTGSLYETYRDPTLLLKVIQNLILKGEIDISKIKLIYIGKDGKEWRTFFNPFPILQKALIIENMSDRDYALICQQKAHINLLLNWSFGNNGGTIPAKIYEYIGSSNYIIGLIKGKENNAMSELIENLNMGAIFRYEEHGVENKLSIFLLDLYRQWIKNKFTSPKISETMKESLKWASKQKELTNLLSTL